MFKPRCSASLQTEVVGLVLRCTDVRRYCDAPFLQKRSKKGDAAFLPKGANAGKKLHHRGLAQEVMLGSQLSGFALKLAVMCKYVHGATGNLGLMSLKAIIRAHTTSRRTSSATRS